MSTVKNAQKIIGPLKVVRVAVPDAAHFDKSKMEEIMHEILERIGCTNCHSGHDIRFIREGDFRVTNVEGKIHVTELTERIR